MFESIHQKLLLARERMEKAQSDVLSSGGHPDCIQLEKECLYEFLSISRAEESYFKQKSRNQWLQLGDQNNAFFHRMVKARSSKNSIHFLWDDHGQKVAEKAKIKEVVVAYYQKLLGTNTIVFDTIMAERVS